VARRRLLALGFTLACVAGLATASGAGVAATRAPGRRALGAGLSIVVPARWHVALRLTGLAEPFERFTLASFALRRPAHPGCGPDQAVETMPADGALAFVVEFPRRGAPRESFPRQPKHFTLPAGPAHQYDCFPLGWLVRFQAGDRPFQIMIALGRDAGSNRDRLLRALNTFHVDVTSGSG
jgi:hypothetical protein